MLGGVPAAEKRDRVEGSEEPEAKRTAGSNGTSDGSGSAGACSWGSGATKGGCTWGSGASFASSIASSGGGFGALASAGGGFGAVASTGGGFGAVASAGGGFGAVGETAGSAFTSATTFAPKNTSPAMARASSRGAESGTEEVADEAPSTVEAATTGEEDEVCVHRVRAKLFRLEVRMEPRRRVLPAAAQGADAPASAEAQGSEGGAPSPAAVAPADESAAGDAAAAPASAPAASSVLNPLAKPFVPAGAESGSKGGAASSGDDGEDGGDADVAAAAAADDEDDDGKGASEAAGKGAAEGEAEADGTGEKEETTRWVERGVGQLRLLVHKTAAATAGAAQAKQASAPFPRLVMRVEHVGRLILNESLLPSMAPAERASETSVRLVLVSASAGPQSYLLRVKTPVEAETLVERINSTRPPLTE